MWFTILARIGWLLKEASAKLALETLTMDKTEPKLQLSFLSVTTDPLL